MGRLTRYATAEPVSRDQILGREREHGNIHFPCSADHEQGWQPYPVDPYSAICDEYTYMHTYIHIYVHKYILTYIWYIIRVRVLYRYTLDFFFNLPRTDLTENSEKAS